ncbi:TNF receptor-associated factor 5-like [Ornithodoros turicata]|uniref:TNF receptor-associated factor 5-like n=1 Tax=Ornithodoros turicata TaxID=34597 RepID=UPI00313A3ACF
MPKYEYMSGFSDAIDWRPVEFVDLPSVRSCSLCHVVPTETFFLECSHALCSHCYKALLQGNRACPLDGGTVEEDEVQTLTFKPSHLKKQKMHCCNSSHGCDFVGILDEVKTHFLKNCAFHVATCNRCHATILRDDIIHHYTEQQCQAASSTGNDSQVSTNGNIFDIERKMDVALDTVMERLCTIETQLNVHVVNIDGAKQGISANGQALSRLLDQQEQISGDMIHQLEELTKCVDTGKRVLSEIISAGAVTSAEVISHTSTVGENGDEADIDEEGRCRSRALRGSPDQSASEVKDAANDVKGTMKVVLESCKKLRSAEEMLRELQSVTRLVNNVAYYHIERFADIEKESLAEKQVTRTSDVFHLFGYSAKLRVDIRTYDGVLYIGAFLCICQSSKDSCLKWPFTLPYAVMLVHPTDDTKSIEYDVDVLKSVDKYGDCFIKPVGAANVGFGARQLCKLQDAVNNGFVHNDSITLGVRILQQVY